MSDIVEQITAVRERIAQAAARAGRDAHRIRLIAVSKTHPAARVQQALAAGVNEFGENRLQEAEPKIGELQAASPRPIWHLIGHLQRNKAKRAAVLFDWVHSLDSLELAQVLDRGRAARPDLPPLAVLLQVNISGEATKFGFDLPGGVAAPAVAGFVATAQQIATLPHLHLAGLMTIAPYHPDPEQARPVFRGLRALQAQLQAEIPTVQWQHLSMGMTDDMEVAIEEGATMVRVGRAIFGERI